MVKNQSWPRLAGRGGSVIQQGQKYTHGLNTVLALESGEGEVKVCRLEEDTPWVLSRPYVAHARELAVLPVRYLGGALPGDWN